MAKRQPITSKKVLKKSSPSKKRTPRTLKVRNKRAIIYSAPQSKVAVLTQFSTFIAPLIQQATKAITKKTHTVLAQTQQHTKSIATVLQAQTKVAGTRLRNKQVELTAQVIDQVTEKKRVVTTTATSFQKRISSQVKKLLKPTRKKKAKKKIISKKKPLIVKKKTAKASSKTTTARKVGTFLYQEFCAPFVYIFRYHPWITFGSLFLSVLILLGSYFTYDFVFKDLPEVTSLTQRKQILTTKILDRNGKLLYSIYKDENRTLIPLSRIPDHVKWATIAIEDRNFYSHKGFSVRGIVRALKSNAQGEQVQGGSTITQQLVKNTLLSPERTFKRKVREILLAFLMEGTYTKDEILEMYFNEVPYGGSTYGIEEAAYRYFGKSAPQLTLAEAAFLAGLPAAPTVYSPFGATPEYAYVRQHEVLRRMVEDKYITEEQAQKAKAEVLQFREDTTDIKAPHFVMYVRSLLAQEYGEERVSQGGLEVRTTLDLDTQNKTQDIVTKEIDSLERLRITNGAALVTNPQTGEILAMVGSKNYFDFTNDGQVNVTLRPRQPGSSIKPLTYALALEKGSNPSSIIEDAPITFNLPGSPPYSPKNYDGKFHGKVTLRESLGSSFNIPAVKTLASVGISNMIDKGEEMGISTWGDRKRFGLSLTLGGGEVLMVDLAQVYGTFANQGETVSLNPILEVKDAHGEVLYQNSCALEKKLCPAKRTLSSKVAYQITDILSDNVARTPAFGPRSVLVIPGQQVAVKTGTTNNLKDNWTVGYTSDRVVAVWVGNNDGRPMSYVASGITGASPIWNKIIRTQLSDTEPHKFSLPEGLIKVKVCAQTGTLPCRGCPSVKEELFTPGTEPTKACNPAVFQPRPTPDPSKILEGVMIGQ
jgi:1A family penicillin-binding protein